MPFYVMEEDKLPMNKRNRRHSLRDPEPLPIDETSIEEVSLEELEEETLQHNRDRDADIDELIFTKYTDGSTTNPADAQEQGIDYDSLPSSVTNSRLRGTCNALRRPRRL